MTIIFNHKRDRSEVTQKQPKFQTNSAARQRLLREMRALEKVLKADREAAYKLAQEKHQMEALIQVELQLAQKAEADRVKRLQQLTDMFNSLLQTEAGQAIERGARLMAESGNLIEAILMIHETRLTAEIIKDTLETRRTNLICDLPFTPGDFLADRKPLLVIESMEFKQWLKARGTRGGSAARRARLVGVFCTSMGWEYTESV